MTQDKEIRQNGTMIRRENTEKMLAEITQNNNRKDNIKEEN